MKETQMHRAALKQGWTAKFPVLLAALGPVNPPGPLQTPSEQVSVTRVNGLAPPEFAGGTVTVERLEAALNGTKEK